MALEKQVHIYSVDTSAFYYEDERKMHNRLNGMYILRFKIKKRRKKIYKKYNKNKQNKQYITQKQYIDNLYTRINKLIFINKEKLIDLFHKNAGKSRLLNDEYINDKNVVSIFESALTDIFNLPINELSEDIIIVKTYFFDILEDIILNDFIYNNTKYSVYTASAGQIRTKKTVFVKNKLLKKYENALTCGLSDEIMNQRGDININKYLAYRALQNSATDKWLNFDIDKCIVVDDFETTVNAEVDFIDDETYKITRMKRDVPIPHTDGCGMILNQKTKMVRLPWIKGLLIFYNYKLFILEAREKYHDNTIGVIKDIYEVQHDIIKEDIQIIFTKSQFKMYKFYKDWDEYKRNFKLYNCQARYCNEEEKNIKNAKINYQMLQTLYDMTDNELKKICKTTQQNIVKVTHDIDTMKIMLGVTKYNTHKNYLQQGIEIYPELLNDPYCKQVLQQVRDSAIKKAYSAKLYVNGKYTFISPDLYAFCEWLFLHIKNPKGLLKKNEVSCNLYNDNQKLDCLRSPHLMFEHCVRKNIIKDSQRKWFDTKCLYTSCHDIISKILMFDVDGDKSLVCSDKTIIKVAERIKKNHKIVPLYYNMKKAGSMKVDRQTIYNGLVSAYTGGNIGMYSNNITKIWNNKHLDLEAIKFLCMENNFTIDYAKTLYKPKRPKDIKEQILRYTRKKVPHFFIYAKDKDLTKVENKNNSIVNRISTIIPNYKVDFQNIGKFYYRRLMFNPSFQISEQDLLIINKYNELDLKKVFFINRDKNDYKISNEYFIYQKIRSEILQINNNEKYVVDILIKYLYENKETNKKITLWESFGDVIIDNLIQNLTKNFKYEAIHCEQCGKLIEKKNNRTKYCDTCWKEINKKQTKKRVEKLRKSKNVTV